MKKIIFAAFVTTLVLDFSTSAALAQLIDQTTDQPNLPTTWGGSFRSALLTIINFFLFFLGIVTTGMIIYGGFQYIMSQGEESKVESAKKILIYAAIGILVILASYALVNTLLGAGTNVRPV